MFLARSPTSYNEHLTNMQQDRVNLLDDQHDNFEMNEIYDD